MEKRLEKLDKWLKNNFNDYLSMIAIGSIATNDYWIDGRSDRDILLVFEDNSKNKDNIEDFLKKLNFDETYIFTAIRKEEFIGPENNSHDFSHKFRSKTIFGNNLIEKVKLPKKEQIFEIYSKGLNEVVSKLKGRLHYGKLWPTEKIRDNAWKLFKHSFMYLAIKCYYDKKIYPKTREDVAKEFDSNELFKTLLVLNNIDDKSKEEIHETYTDLINFLKKQN